VICLTAAQMARESQDPSRLEIGAPRANNNS